MAKEIQILNNGDALYDIRRKINENFKLIRENVEDSNTTYRFCVNQGNLTNDVEDLLYSSNSQTLDFKVGGLYRDLVATKADGTKFNRLSVNSRNVSTLSNGIYNVFLDEQDTELLSNTILTTGQEQVAQFNDILYDPLTFECKKCLPGGMSLTPATAYTTVSINGVTFGAGKYIAVGGQQNAVILSSIDGKNWQDVQLGGASPLTQVIYTGKSFVAVGNNATIIRSIDGVNWTTISVSNLSYTNQFLSIATNGTRIIVGGSSSFTFYSDDDGLTWQSGTRLSGTALGYVRTIAYGDGIWLASSDTGHYYRSTDNGLTWEQRNLGISDNMTRIRSLNRKFFAVSNSGLVLQSTEGLNWTQHDTGENVALTDISYFNNAYYCTSSSSIVFRTTDFQTWAQISTNVSNMSLIGAYQNILVGNPGKIFNIDGTTWQQYTKVPVGTVTVSNGTIINVETFPYNRTQYNGLLATPTTYGLLRVAAETDEMDCSCNDASITPANLYDLANYRRVNTQYNVDDKVGCPYHHNLQLKCIEAGTTSTEALDTKSGLEVGGIIEDGSVKWQIEELGTGGSGDSATTFVIRDGNIEGGKADLIYELGIPYYYVDQTPEAYKDNVVDIATSSNFGDSQNNWWWGQSGGVFGWELGTGFKAYSYHSGPGGTNGQGGQSGQITSVIHTFETPLPAGIYQFKCAGYSGFNTYYLYMTVDGVEQQVTVPTGMTDKEWSFTEEITVEGEITQIRAQSAGSIADWGIGPVHLIQKVLNDDFENVLKFKVGSLYPSIKCVDAEGYEFEKKELNNVELPMDDSNGVHTIYVSEEKGAYTLPYPLYRQSGTPSLEDGTVWVDTSKEPLEIKQYDGYKWVPFNDVPLGYCVVTAGIITKVYTYDYYTKVDRRDMVECATVIETYSNEGSWYRVWSDGWCEQGVHKDNWGDSGTYTLLVPYRDTNYTIVFNGWKDDSTSNLGIQSITPTEIQYNNYDTSLKGDLYVCGYLPEERIYD